MQDDYQQWELPPHEYHGPSEGTRKQLLFTASSTYSDIYKAHPIEPCEPKAAVQYKGSMLFSFRHHSNICESCNVIRSLEENNDLAVHSMQKWIMSCMFHLNLYVGRCISSFVALLLVHFMLLWSDEHIKAIFTVLFCSWMRVQAPAWIIYRQNFCVIRLGMQWLMSLSRKDTFLLHKT